MTKFNNYGMHVLSVQNEWPLHFWIFCMARTCDFDWMNTVKETNNYEIRPSIYTESCSWKQRMHVMRQILELPMAGNKGIINNLLYINYVQITRKVSVKFVFPWGLNWSEWCHCFFQGTDWVRFGMTSMQQILFMIRYQLAHKSYKFQHKSKFET